MARLSLRALGTVPLSARPLPHPQDVSIGIVHLGIGAFARAHQAVYTENAMAAADEPRWGICGVSQRSATALGPLRAQDCLYSVNECTGATSNIRVVGAVRQALFAQEQWSALAEHLSSPAVTVVTTTVTEKGYHASPSTQRLLRHDPDIVSDAQGGPPRTVVGQICRGLQARREADAGPITVLCCDNLPANGATVRALVADFCELLGPEEDGLGEWVSANVSFPNTMVDRIVPAATDLDRRRAAAFLGVVDEAALVTEPFSQWVLEDTFAGPRPAWERVGASLVPSVAPYEQMKLRLLNGGHSVLGYLGSLAGFEYIADAAGNPELARFLRLFMDVDVTPTLSVPSGTDLDAYKQALRERFANPALRHRTAQVAMDGTQKLPSRLVRTVRDRLMAGAEPRYACLAIAAWMRCVSAGATDQGAPLTLEDPLADHLRAVLAGSTSPGAVATVLLGLTEVFPPEVAENEAVRRMVTEDLAILTRHGALAAATAV